MGTVADLAGSIPKSFSNNRRGEHNVNYEFKTSWDHPTLVCLVVYEETLLKR